MIGRRRYCLSPNGEVGRSRRNNVREVVILTRRTKAYIYTQGINHINTWVKAQPKEYRVQQLRSIQLFTTRTRALNELRHQDIMVNLAGKEVGDIGYGLMGGFSVTTSYLPGLGLME